MSEEVVGPARHTCPITQEPIEVPACTEVGSVYEFAALVGTDLTRDPLTGEPLPHWPVFKFARLDASLLSMHARKGTVQTELREWCVKNLVVPALGMAAIKEPDAFQRRAVLHCLANVGKADSAGDRVDALREAAELLRLYKIALPNKVLGQWLAESEAGKKVVVSLRSVQNSRPSDCFGHWLLFMCKNPTDDGFGLRHLLGPSVYCYHGQFADKLPVKDEFELLCSNRASLFSL
jgi:hypothetical protein